MITAVSLLKHPVSVVVAVTTYVVVISGVATGFEIVLLLKPVAGVHA